MPTQYNSPELHELRSRINGFKIGCGTVWIVVWLLFLILIKTGGV